MVFCYGWFLLFRMSCCELFVVVSVMVVWLMCIMCVVFSMLLGVMVVNVLLLLLNNVRLVCVLWIVLVKWVVCFVVLVVLVLLNGLVLGVVMWIGVLLFVVVVVGSVENMLMDMLICVVDVLCLICSVDGMVSIGNCVRLLIMCSSVWKLLLVVMCMVCWLFGVVLLVCCGLIDMLFSLFDVVRLVSFSISVVYFGVCGEWLLCINVWCLLCCCLVEVSMCCVLVVCVCVVVSNVWLWVSLF